MYYIRAAKTDSCHPFLSSAISNFASVLQIRRGNRDNLGIIFYKNLFCDTSLEFLAETVLMKRHTCFH